MPPSAEKRLFSVDAGIATVEQFAAVTDHDALVGRLRKHVALRRAPRPRRGRRGRPPVHGPVLHPGAQRPEGRADEETTLTVEGRQVRVRRWNTVHFARAPQTVLDVVRVDDPGYKRPLVIGTTARELTTAEMRQADGHRWPVETNFFVAQGTCAMGRGRAPGPRRPSAAGSAWPCCVGCCSKRSPLRAKRCRWGPGTAKRSARRGAW